MAAKQVNNARTMVFPWKLIPKMSMAMKSPWHLLPNASVKGCDQQYYCDVINAADCGNNENATIFLYYHAGVDTLNLIYQIIC